MPLKLVHGLANAGKTGIVLGDMIAAAANGASPTLVVPTLSDVRRIESELAYKAPLGVRATTLGAFKAEMWQLAGDGRRTVGATAREALMRSILGDEIPTALQGAAKTPGFIRFLARCAQEAGPGGASAAEILNPTARAVWSVVTRYTAALEEHGLVEGMWLGELIAGLDVRLPGPLGVARFDAFSAADAKFLVALSKSNRVTVAVTWEDGAAQTRANDPAIAELMRVADEVVVASEPPPSGELDGLARALYGAPSGLESTGAVIAALAAGAEAETALVAQIVAREIREGVEPGRIAVAFPGFSERADLLRHSLTAEGVLASLDYPRGLGHTAFGRAFLSLAALGLGTGGRAEASVFAASPYSGMTPAQAQEADRSWRGRRVSEARSLLNTLERRGVRSAVIARATSEGGAVEAIQNWQEMATVLFETVWDSADPLEVSFGLHDDARAYRALLRALAELEAERAYLGSSVGALETLKNVAVREDGEDALNAVQVCETRDIGARRFDVLILGGLTSREWPLESLSPLMDATRGSGESGDVASADRRRLDFYSLITRARHRLYLVRQAADSDGRALRPSVFYEEVVDAYRAPESAYDEESPLLDHHLTMARSDIEALAPALTTERRIRRQQAGEMVFTPPIREAVEDDAALSALARLDVFSATEVEAYLECPYKWFHSRVVRPGEIDAELGARELGTEAHRLLARFYRALPERIGLNRVTSATLEQAFALLDAIQEEDVGSSPRPSGLAEEMAVSRAASWVRDAVSQDAHLLPGFAPVGIERGFGDDDAPFVFAGARFRGAIDRIDVGERGSFVTDYKSSRSVSGVAKFETDGRVQAVIYARATEALYGQPVCGSVYRSLRSGQLRGFWRSDLLGSGPAGTCDDDAICAAGYAELIAATEERTYQAIAGMREGRIPRRPAVKGACNYCALAGFCEGAG